MQKYFNITVIKNGVSKWFHEIDNSNFLLAIFILSKVMKNVMEKGPWLNECKKSCLKDVTYQYVINEYYIIYINDIKNVSQMHFSLTIIILLLLHWKLFIIKLLILRKWEIHWTSSYYMLCGMGLKWKSLRNKWWLM